MPSKKQPSKHQVPGSPFDPDREVPNGEGPNRDAIVLALDVGTSSVRCLGFNGDGSLHSGISASKSHRPLVTTDGGSELDPEALFEDTMICLAEAAEAARVAKVPILAVGVCTFWHAFLACDATGSPLTPLYLWNDMRAAEAASGLREALDEVEVHRRTGCVIHPSYLPARLSWLRKDRPEAFDRATAFVSFGEFLEWRLFGSPRIGHSMASGTGLYDQVARTWDEPVMAELGLRPDRLSPLEPGYRPRRGMKGDAARRLPALAEVPFFPALGDGACSNLGSGATRSGQGALMVGTSAALRVFHPSPPEHPPPAGLWRYRLDEGRALTGGALSNGGNVFFWLQEVLRLPEEPQALDALLAGRAPAAHGLTVMPFLFGERNPDYPLDATGMVLGLRGAHTALDIAQACLEAVAYRLAAIADRLRLAEPDLTEWIASGGLLNLPHWMGIICDVLGMPLVVSTVQEASARGAALMALEGLGVMQDAHLLPAPMGERIQPDPSRHAAYRRARDQHERGYRQESLRE